MNSPQFGIRLLTLLVANLVFAGCSQRTPDLTGATSESFAANLDHVISIEGRLSVGKQGYSVSNAMPENVVFYVVPKMPESGAYGYPESWQKLLDHQVRLTGKLQFRLGTDVPAGRDSTSTPSYYYMVLQDTEIQGKK